MEFLQELPFVSAATGRYNGALEVTSYITSFSRTKNKEKYSQSLKMDTELAFVGSV